MRQPGETVENSSHIAGRGGAAILRGMDGSTRWILIAAVLGLCTAYALWGGRAAVAPETGPSVDVKPVQSIGPTVPPKGTENPAPPVAKESVLKLNPGTVDFGEVKVTESKTLSVQVENPGKDAITIEDVKGSCGCLKVEMPQKKIEPGKSAALNLSFTGQAGKRPEAYTVTLTTSEAGRPRAVLPIKGKVIQIFIVDPMTIYFEDAAKGVPKTQEATITRVDGQPFTIKTISATHKELSFNWDPIEGSNRSAYKIKVTVTGIEPGAFTEGAAILTDHPVVPAVPLHLGVRITGDVVSSTMVLTAMQGADTTVAPFETVIKRITPGPLIIKGITESDKRPIEYTQTRIDESSCRVSITLKGEFPNAVPFGDFIVQSNVEDTPLHVAYRVVRRGAQLFTPGNAPKLPPAEKVLRP